jgi:hypothetical protein
VRTLTRCSPAASASRGTIAMPIPRATRLRIVLIPSNSHGTGAVTPASASSPSTSARRELPQQAEPVQIEH